MGFETNEFPAFYTQKSGIKTLTPVKSERKLWIFILQTGKHFLNSVLVANPMQKDEIPSQKIKSIIDLALKKATSYLFQEKKPRHFY